MGTLGPMTPLLFGLLATSCTSKPEPLVILVVIDTLRADALSFSGAPVPDASPAIASLKEESVWMSRAYSSASWTLPATTTLLTGLHPWQHRVVRQSGTAGCFGRLREDIPTAASVAKQRNQRTAAFINNAFLAPEFGLHQSFDVYDFHGAKQLGHRTAMETVNKALAWVDESQEGGFLVVHIMEPHTDYDPGATWLGHYTADMPHTVEIPIGAYTHNQWLTGQAVPTEQDKAYIRAAYQEEVRASDEAVGVLVQGLKDRGRWEAATFVLTSDHGEAFWERGIFEHGATLMDEVTRVPLLIKAPGLPPGDNDRMVDGTFVFPLLVDSESDTWAQVRDANVEPVRPALMQGMLYRNQQISMVTREHRLLVDLSPAHDGQRYAHLFPMDASGTTALQPLPPDHPDQGIGQAGLKLLTDLRGDLGPTVPTNPQGVVDSNVFEQLRAQGYLDGNDCL
ncbi:MAG: hypothetical protein ACI9VR_003501 [Cognaticolwellia sp.]|jgi:hypothetical protein